jgi:lipopolysaccharide biosynthesis glycosyltransferase
LERSIWIGFDHREAQAFAVARHSINRFLTQPIPVFGIVLRELQRLGLYTRPIETRVVETLCHCGCGKVVAEATQLWDPISDAPMSTEFAISRFFTPVLACHGWAMFCDCDVLSRKSIARLFEEAETKPHLAVMVVKHNHVPDYQVKMEGQAQTRYARKNWSSVMLFNCDHPSNKALSLEMLNTLPGRDLHRFCWLKDEEIGELPPEWNYLVGHTKTNEAPCMVHFTDGVPFMKGYETCEFSDEYRSALEAWALGNR